MLLVGIGVVPIGQGLGGPVPSLGSEGTTFTKAELDGLAEGSEEGFLVGGIPAESRSTVFSTGPGTGVGPGEIVVGHGD